ncbi:putative 14.1 kDa [Guinea pig adenovirus 1]|uniref:14.1 kDa n=1 Tax=Guinea pig adenovirus 1 TaxID=2847100 RepID=A0AC61M0A9_9ADEN|nr:putative 14.1 kDa [Guinea pig adenovirus]QIZ64153.1 putative 14.1 kDa [Guinea pig adenovirus 1]QIZ64185.1 putative 14.1 kDa [Guinea pig adenovirus]
MRGVSYDVPVDVSDVSVVREGHRSRHSESEREFHRINVAVVGRDLSQDLGHVAALFVKLDVLHEAVYLVLGGGFFAGASHRGGQIRAHALHETEERVVSDLVPHACVDHLSPLVPRSHDGLSQVDFHVTGKQTVPDQGEVQVVQRGGHVLGDEKVDDPTAQGVLSDVIGPLQFFHGGVKVDHEIEHALLPGLRRQHFAQLGDGLRDGGADLASKITRIGRGGDLGGGGRGG